MDSLRAKSNNALLAVDRTETIAFSVTPHHEKISFLLYIPSTIIIARREAILPSEDEISQVHANRGFWGLFSGCFFCPLAMITVTLVEEVYRTSEVVNWGIGYWITEKVQFLSCRVKPYPSGSAALLIYKPSVDLAVHKDRLDPAIAFGATVRFLS